MSNFANLDSSVLEAITGGTAKTKEPSSSGSSALTSQLSSLQSSIKDLAQQKPQSTFGNTNTVLLFCALAMNRPAPAANVVYVGRRFW